MSPANRPSPQATHARYVAALAKYGTGNTVSGFNGSRPTPRRNRSRGSAFLAVVTRDPRYAWSLVHNQG